MMNNLTIYTEQSISNLCQSRAGEQRVWQSISFINQQQSIFDALTDASAYGIKYVLLGIPEDIGPRANLGNGGAELGWQAFLAKFLNLQANQFIASNKVLLLGEVDCIDIMKRGKGLSNQDPVELDSLRSLCGEIDDIASPILKMIFDAGLEPIVIGGGHNNCYPIIKALSESTEQACCAINLDPHADFRAIEGRHSGNGFSYAYQQNYLRDYHVIAMHELKNNQAIIDGMHDAGFSFDSYQAIKVRQEISLNDANQAALARMQSYQLPMGIEVDVDSISYMPVSAFTNCGLAVYEAEQFVYQLALSPYTRYLHLCEAAPSEHANGVNQGSNEAGQILAALVASYLSGREA